MTRKWTVYVGGMEVNDYLLDLPQAIDLASGYLNDGYDDVQLSYIDL